MELGMAGLGRMGSNMVRRLMRSGVRCVVHDRARAAVTALEREGAAVVAGMRPVFGALAPGEAAAPPTPGRTSGKSTAERGWLHCGPHGAGHFVKMVHNAIEYGIMAAYAEGFNLLRHAGAGREARAVDAETTPLRHPEHYPYSFDVADIAELWRRGSVIPSWLLDLSAQALAADGTLAGFSGQVSDSGEGR